MSKVLSIARHIAARNARQNVQRMSGVLNLNPNLTYHAAMEEARAMVQRATKQAQKQFRGMSRYDAVGVRNERLIAAIRKAMTTLDMLEAA